MLTTLLLVNSWPFWFLLFCVACGELYLIENKEDAGAVTVLALATVIVSLSFTDWRPWNSSIGFGWLLIYTVLYFLIGAAYAFIIRWSVYVIDKTKAYRPKYAELKKLWEENPDLGRWLEGRKGEKPKYPTLDHYVRDTEKMPPMPWDSGAKGKVYMWMVYWPISGAWVIIHKPLEYFYDWAYAFAKQKMALISYALFKAHIE